MGRPALRKKGAFTAAERQRRRRGRLRRAQRQAEVEAIRRENWRKYQQHEEQAAADERAAGRDPDRWVEALPMPPLAPADELARQIAECLVVEEARITIDDLRDALDRLFGPRAVGRPDGDVPR